MHAIWESRVINVSTALPGVKAGDKICDKSL